MATEVALTSGSETSPRNGIVDCDVHVRVARDDDLLAHLPKRWRYHRSTFGSRTYESEFYVRTAPLGQRVDSFPPSGLLPGADIDFLREQLLDAYGIKVGIMTPFPYPAEERNPDYAVALSRAVNDWQLEHWIAREPRMRASLFLTPDEPDAALAEIERRAGDERFVQVFLAAGTNEPAGSRRYWRIYEAAAANGLPVAFHTGAHNGHPHSPAGFPSFYLENHTGAAIMFQEQVTSLVFQGTFTAIPDLKIVLIEGGVAWMAPLMWRLDRAWRKLRDEIPALDRPPSEYIRDHFWMTTQPIEEPANPLDFLYHLEHMGMSDRLMYASDYPHWDFDDPRRVLPSCFGRDLRNAIMGGTARELYGFAAKR